MFVVENKARIESAIIAIEIAFLFVFRKFLFPSPETSGVWEWIFFSVFFLGLMPLLTARLVFKRPLSDFHVGGKAIKNPLLTLLVVLLLLAAIAAIVVKLNWTEVFSVRGWVRGGLWLTLFMDILFLWLVVLAQEFFFRGFLQSTVARAWGMTAAVIASTAAASAYVYFFTAHITVSKAAFLILFQLALGILAQANQSIRLTVFLNWAFLFIIDLLAVYKISQLQ